MELGPDLIALLTRLQGLDPSVLDGLLGSPAGSAGGGPGSGTAATAAVLPPRAHFGVVTPPRSILEKFRTAEADTLLPHYGALMLPFECVYPGNEAARIADVLSFAEAERPVMVVGVMRDNVPELVPLWGPTRHLDPPYARTSAHKAHVFFCRDVVQGNLPASTIFDCDWLITKN
jgi:hypothetical protein